MARYVVALGSCLVSIGAVEETPSLGVKAVSCGNHMAASCAQCPQGNGAGWCHGDCYWDSKTGACHVSSGPIMLTLQNYTVVTKDKFVFVRHFSPWCLNSRALKPTWDRLATQFLDHPRILVGDIDCIGSGASLCEKHRIQGYPTLMWGKPAALIRYAASIEYDNLVAHAFEIPTISNTVSCGNHRAKTCLECQQGNGDCVWANHVGKCLPGRGIKQFEL